MVRVAREARAGGDIVSHEDVKKRLRSAESAL
jgi:hypothetical protein